MNCIVVLCDTLQRDHCGSYHEGTAIHNHDTCLHIPFVVAHPEYGTASAATSPSTSIRTIAEYDITWVEEPVPPENTAGHHEISAETDVPLAAGEAHFGRFEFTSLITENIVDIVQPNLGRCGGFAEALYLARLATTENVVVRPHVWNSAIGTAAALQFLATVPSYPHASTITPETRLFKFDCSENPLRDDLLVEPFVPTGGSLTVPDSLGSASKSTRVHSTNFA